MKFKEVPGHVKFPELEEQTLAFWKEQDVFQKSMKQREGEPSYVFYEGPPTANGLPGIHHVLARVFKDLFPRYKTMKGYYCYRQGGWDTHGLPVELEVEKELGFSGKEEIEKFGVAEFNRKCRDSVFRYVREWEALTDRIGFWVKGEFADLEFLFFFSLGPDERQLRIDGLDPPKLFAHQPDLQVMLAGKLAPLPQGLKAEVRSPQLDPLEQVVPRMLDVQPQVQLRVGPLDRHQKFARPGGQTEPPGSGPEQGEPFGVG